jgi:hypothetical protein
VFGDGGSAGPGETDDGPGTALGGLLDLDEAALLQLGQMAGQVALDRPVIRWR